MVEAGFVVVNGLKIRISFLADEVLLMLEPYKLSVIIAIGLKAHVGIIDLIIILRYRLKDGIISC